MYLEYDNTSVQYSEIQPNWLFDLIFLFHIPVSSFNHANDHIFFSELFTICRQQYSMGLKASRDNPFCDFNDEILHEKLLMLWNIKKEEKITSSWFKQYLFDISNHRFTQLQSRIWQQDKYLM